MKTTQLMSVCSAGLVALHSAQGQTAFQDLDFESGNISNPSGYYNEVPIANALPGWSGSIGGVPVAQVWANNYSTGEATIDVFGPGWPSIGYGESFGEGIIDGNYTVFLQSGANPQGGSAGVNVSIWQTGTIPASAQTLEFKAWTFEGIGDFSVSFDGNTLSLVVLSEVPGKSATGVPVYEYGVNIAPYAGQTGELEFTSIIGDQGASWTELDDITFSTTTVTPEPNTLALAVIGGLALAARRWRRLMRTD
jgi:hypothetical protein